MCIRDSLSPLLGNLRNVIIELSPQGNRIIRHNFPLRDYYQIRFFDLDTNSSICTGITGVPDVDIKILSNLPDPDLMSICQTNQYIYSLCRTSRLWRQKLEDLLPYDIFREVSLIKNNMKLHRDKIIPPENNELSWKQLYKIFVLYQRLALDGIYLVTELGNLEILEYMEDQLRIHLQRLNGVGIRRLNMSGLE